MVRIKSIMNYGSACCKMSAEGFFDWIKKEKGNSNKIIKTVFK